MSRKAGITQAAQAQIKRSTRLASTAVKTNDSFQNFAARVGFGTDNLSSASSYGFNPISRIQTLLEWMYRGSWIVGQAVDCIAEDMTKAGVEYRGENDPEDISKMEAGLVRHQVWHKCQDTIKWARLYGGAIAAVMIDGQDPSTPLRLETIGPGAFQGLLVLDRWMVTPSLEDLVTDIRSPDLGLPKYYRVVTAAAGIPRITIHHTRCLRLVGVELPFWQKISENMWGMSVIERLYDRLIAFDSGTQGASQMMYKAYLRTLKIPQLRSLISAGGPAYEGLLQQVQLMRNMQSNEGMSIIDADDTFETQQYSFAGVSDTLLQFGQQLSGALQIPLVRLFGQSPSGLNASGESDLRTYYDGINQRQETMLRSFINIVSRVIAQSEGVRLDPSFNFKFNPLWQITDDERAQIAERNTNTVLAAEAAGLVDIPTALRELKQQSNTTGLWTNITDEMIQAAELAPPPETDAILDQLLNPGLASAAPGATPPPGQPKTDPEDEPTHETQAPGASAGSPKPPQGKPAFARDSLPLIDFRGMPIMVENPAGSRREGPGWSVQMPADYGYIRRTGSAEGTDEGMDCFVGLDPQSESAWVIDQCDPLTGKFDEHKVMLGFLNSDAALDCYGRAYHDGGRGRIMGVTHMALPQLQRWLAEGDVTQALSKNRPRPPLRAVR